VDKPCGPWAGWLSIFVLTLSAPTDTTSPRRGARCNVQRWRFQLCAAARILVKVRAFHHPLEVLQSYGGRSVRHPLIVSAHRLMKHFDEEFFRKIEPQGLGVLLQLLQRDPPPIGSGQLSEDHLGGRCGVWGGS
jgi:hypothetical protein